MSEPQFVQSQFPAVQSVLHRVASGETLGYAIAWVWFHGMSSADKRLFESQLVILRHPLASQPGLPEWRFGQVCSQAAASAACQSENE